jgi:hypothetical protein
MAYAELGSAMPEAGGGYLWIKGGPTKTQCFYQWLDGMVCVPMSHKGIFIMK